MESQVKVQFEYSFPGKIHNIAVCSNFKLIEVEDTEGAIQIYKHNAVEKILLEIQLKQHISVWQLSSDGAFCVISCGNEAFVLQFGKKLVNIPIVIPEKVSAILISGTEILLGCQSGNTYSQLFASGKLSIPKIVQSIRTPVRGIDQFSLPIPEVLQNLAHHCGCSPCSSKLDANSRPIDYLKPSQLTYPERKMAIYFVLIGADAGIRIIWGRGQYVSDVLLAAQRFESPNDYQFTHILPNGVDLGIENVRFQRSVDGVSGWTWIAAQHDYKKSIVQNETQYVSEQELRAEQKAGWETVGQGQVDEDQAAELFQSKQVNEIYTTQIFTSDLPSNLVKLYNGFYNIIEGGEKQQQLSASNFLAKEANFLAVFETSALQVSTFTNSLLMCQNKPIGAVIGNHEILVQYANKAIVISKVNKRTVDIMSINDILSSSNIHPIEPLQLMLHWKDQIFVGSNSKLLKYNFQDSGEAWKDFLNYKQYEMALKQVLGNERATLQIKTQMALESIQKQRVVDGAAELGKLNIPYYSSLYHLHMLQAKSGLEREAMAQVCIKKLEQLDIPRILQTARKNQILKMDNHKYDEEPFRNEIELHELANAGLCGLCVQHQQIQQQIELETDQIRTTLKQQNLKLIQLTMQHYVDSYGALINSKLVTALPLPALQSSLIEKQDFKTQFYFLKVQYQIQKSQRLKLQIFDLINTRATKNEEQIVCDNAQFLFELDRAEAHQFLAEFCRNNAVHELRVLFAVNSLPPQLKIAILREVHQLKQFTTLSTQVLLDALVFSGADAAELVSNKQCRLPFFRVCRQLTGRALIQYLTTQGFTALAFAHCLKQSEFDTARGLVLESDETVRPQMLQKLAAAMVKHKVPLHVIQEKLFVNRELCVDVEQLLSEQQEIGAELKQLIKARLVGLQLEVEQLNDAIKMSNTGAQQIDSEIALYKKRSIKFDNVKCRACRKGDGEIIAFNCTHCFHYSCLLKHYDVQDIFIISLRVKKLKDQMDKILWQWENIEEAPEKEKKQFYVLKNQMIELLSSRCPICGIIMEELDPIWLAPIK